MLVTNEDPISSASLNRSEVFEAAKHNLDFFASLAMPANTRFKFPPIYHAIWSVLTEKSNLPRDFAKVALGLPRGFAKTTFMKLLILWCICYTDRRFFLIIGSNAAKAENILHDVAAMLDEPNIIAVYGNWKLGTERDTNAFKIFGFRGRLITIAALGSGGDPRGININNARPDFILMDDMQSRDNAESPQLANSLLEWMLGTLMKAKAHDRCMFLFVGNMYPFAGSILRKLKHNAGWMSIITGALLADGESIWPELQSKEQLLEDYHSDLSLGKPEIFLSEVLNDETASTNAVIDINAIPAEKPGILEEAYQGAFIIIDPATDKKNADNTEIGLFYVFDGIPMLVKLVSGKLSPSDTIRKALQLAMESGTSLICVESVAYQYTLLHWFEVICQQIGLAGIELVEIYPGGFSKNARIKEMLYALLKGDVMIADCVRSRVLHQIAQWNPMKRDNVDDLLDLLAYAPKVVVDYGHLAAVAGKLTSAEFDGAHPMELADNSCF